MKYKKLFKTMVVPASLLLSFLYGLVTIQYQIFPFEQLKAIKRVVLPDSNLGPVRGSVPGRTSRDYFFLKKSFFEQHGGQHFDVVFIGDSITDGAEWHELFPGINIANRGIAGDETSGVLARMGSIYSTSAKRAFIMIGINDFSSGRSVDEVYENYRSIVNQLVAHGMQVYIQSTIMAGMYLERVNGNVAELNQRLRQLAAQSDAMTYIELNTALTKDSLLNARYSRDDIHLNGEGYAIWKNIIQPYVK